MKDEDATKLDIDWLKTIAGALAAITTAVLLSTLGAAGTLIGAALGSVAATVGTAVYSQGLARSRARLAAVQEQALQKVGQAQTEVRRAARRGDPSHLPRAEEQLAEAADMLDPSGGGAVGDPATDEPASSTWRERLAVLPWKRVALVAAGLFLLVVGAISAFEALAGRTVSSYTGGSDADGGTTITRITGGSSSSGDDGRDPGRQDDPSGTPAPSDGATPSAEPSEAAPTGEPTEEPTDEPTEDPTPEAPVPTTSPTPSAPASPSATLQ